MSYKKKNGRRGGKNIKLNIYQKTFQAQAR